MSVAAGPARPLPSAGPSGGPPPALAYQHALLFRQVAARAKELLAAAARGGWPGPELAELADYARAEVLRQAAHEEALLFPASPPHAAARLARDHTRLRSAAELLTRVAAGEQPLSPGHLATATRDFVAQLKHHLNDEQQLLGRTPTTKRDSQHRLGSHTRS